mgnify:CR=1 FL=1
MKYYGGCDVGSTYTKAVILDENGKICADTTIRSKINSEVSAKLAMEEVLNKVGLNSSEELGYLIVVFYGYEVDAEIAAETFKFLFKTGNKAATNFYNKMRNEAVRCGRFFDGTGIKNCFLVGFLEGISEVLDKQCTALMIVVPQEVNEGYVERTKDAKKINNRIKARSYYAEESRAEGNRVGRNAISSRQLAMA